MNEPINITVNVVVQRPKTEAEQMADGYAGWCRLIDNLRTLRIAHELKKGNRLFENITTHEQYVAACEADDRRRRKELGFWKYHFGEA
jgi:hypothetical protein